MTWIDPILTDSWMVSESETLDAHEISVSRIRIDVILHITLHSRLVDWATKNGDLVSQVLENLDTIIGFMVGTLAYDCLWVNDSVQGGVVLAFSRISVAENRVLEDCGGIIKGMTCSNRKISGEHRV